MGRLNRVITFHYPFVIDLSSNIQQHSDRVIKLIDRFSGAGSSMQLTSSPVLLIQPKQYEFTNMNVCTTTKFAQFEQRLLSNPECNVCWTSKIQLNSIMQQQEIKRKPIFFYPILVNRFNLISSDGNLIFVYIPLITF